MNKKGIAPMIMIGIGIVIGVVIALIIASLLNQAPVTVDGTCASMEAKFGAVEAGQDVFQKICLNGAEITEDGKSIFQEQGLDPNTIPADKWSIIKVSCHKNEDASWTGPTATIEKTCETGEACSAKGEQDAECVAGQTGPCNENEICDSDAGENWENCSDCPPPEM